MSDEMGTTTTVLTESEPRLADTEQVKHTEGPWFVERREPNRSFISSNSDVEAPIKNGGIYIAHALGKDHEANARLIAAAPDMLAALREIETFLTSEPRATKGGFVCMNEIDLIRAAIAKAEGRAP